jgi:glycosyltransferase involved in cell wall biosynthesis
MTKKMAVITHRSDHRGGMERYALDIAYQLETNSQLAALLTKCFPKSTTLQKAITIRSLGLRWLPAKLQTLLFSIYCWWYKKNNPETILFACSKIFCADIMICGGTHRGYLQATQKPLTLMDRWEIFYEEQAYQRATIVVAHSVEMRQELIALYGIAADKIITLYPPVDQKKFSLKKDPTTRQHFFKQLNIEVGNKRIFLFPSSGHKRKGLDNLLKAFSHFTQDALLLVAGKRPRITQSNLIALGYCSDMPALYAACDYTILASIYEPFGLVAIESILCGTPVLLSEICGCNQVLSEKARINFKADQLETIISAIDTALHTPWTIPHPEACIHYSIDIQDHLEEILHFFKKTVGHHPDE